MGFLTKTDEPDASVPYAGQHWEYKTVNLNFKASTNFEDIFNRLGEQGWEFVMVATNRRDAHQAIFKRAVL